MVVSEKERIEGVESQLKAYKKIKTYNSNILKLEKIKLIPLILF